MADRQRAMRKNNNKRSKNKPHFKQNMKQKELEEISEKLKLCLELKDTQLTCNHFQDSSISVKTLKGLEDAGYLKPTAIQKDGIMLALRGLDVLASAKTGSGKTLAFIVPILELLWHNQWSSNDGLGALVISPTRELALQTFEVLRKVGKYHDFSAGLVIGGKDVESEQSRIVNTNIIICTPGRLLHHFDETPSFHCDDLKILVLDEADRILDLGFSSTMNSIMENLPTNRQTLLYSATQTKSVQDLARLSLKNPEYIAVHEKSKYSTPAKLSQSYVIVELADKINFLFSFIKTHLKCKCIVFLSSCKQVKFLYEVLRKIRPGVPLMAMYGQQKQMKRVGVYTKFCEAKSAVLFATDIAARGLDFPAVNWVVQFDCPESAETYIHRVGRTARYEKGGDALLMLLSMECPILSKLDEKKIPLLEIKANPKKLRSIEGKLQAFCAQDPDIKYWAQRCIVSYARSVFLQHDKTVFDVTKLPLEEFARSCGLLAPPKVRFIKKLQKKVGPIDQSGNNRTQRTQLGIELLSKEDDDDGDDVLVMKSGKQKHIDLNPMGEEEKIVPRKKQVTKATAAKKLLRKNIKVNTKVLFDEDGERLTEDLEEPNIDTSSADGGINIENVKLMMQVQDKVDRANERERIKGKHKEIKRKEKQKRKAVNTLSTVTLASSEEINDSIIPPTEKRKKISAVESDALLEDEQLALHFLCAT